MAREKRAREAARGERAALEPTESERASIERAGSEYAGPEHARPETSGETVAYIGVGSNLSAESHVLEAAARLNREVRLLAASNFYWSAPARGRHQARFLNGVFAVTTRRSPQELKREVLRPIEEALGRRREADPDASRPIDLDLLLYGELGIQENDLVLPDPKIEEHAFVAIPLLDVAPGLVLPGRAARLSESRIVSLVEDLEVAAEFTRKLRAWIVRLQIRQAEERGDEQGPSC